MAPSMPDESDTSSWLGEAWQALRRRSPWNRWSNTLSVICRGWSRMIPSSETSSRAGVRSWGRTSRNHSGTSRRTRSDDHMSEATDASLPSEAPGDVAVSVHGLAKRYGEIQAVAGVDFDIPRGETFGFLGPNGAGKSTTIKMLCTLTTPTAGSATVAG